MRLVVINNLPWAVGFMWPLDASWKGSRTGKQAVLRKKAEKINPAFDTVTFRPRQYGFCAGPGQDHDLSKVRALAGFLTLSSSDFLGIFHLVDVTGEAFWWLFCRHHGRIVTDGDSIYATQAEAEEHAASLRMHLKFEFEGNTICATPADSIAWLSDLLKPGLLDSLRGTARLESLTSPLRLRHRSGMRMLAAVLALLAVFWGVTKLLNYRSVQATQEAKRLAGLNAEKRRAELQARPELHFTQEWMARPLPDALIAQCDPMMREQPMVAGGWLLESLACGEGRLDLSWQYQPGADYLALPEGAALHEQNAKVAISSFPLPALAVQRDGQAFPALLTKEEAARELYHLCQLIGANLQDLRYDKPKFRTIDKVEVTAPWVRAPFELVDVPALLLGDPDFALLLSSIPGLVLESIQYKTSFVYKGSVYARIR